MIRILSLLLRFAENLDRSHDQRVEKAEFIRKKEGVVLSVSCSADCSLEIWAAESEKESNLLYWNGLKKCKVLLMPKLKWLFGIA